MISLDDTIAAISTPAGEGGIGIVRLSGPEARAILRRLFVPAPAAPGEARRRLSDVSDRAQPAPPTDRDAYRLRYGHIVDPATGQAVDEVLAAYMPAPRTYTRQDVVEIDGHGGIVALRRTLALCLRLGARLAEPGEFTARAFLNGRLDLAQAEAVLDVVRARTDSALQAAVGQLAGNLSAQVRSVREGLVHVLAYLEASIDFPEDEIPAQEIGPAFHQARTRLVDLLAEAERGIVYRQGVRTAIVGRPNVGKSSLLNCLLRTSRAIVTDIPGTTRDTLEETLNLQGLPIVLVDTAGISAAARDPIEQLGIERSRAALAQADLALLVLDASEPLTEADRAIAALVGRKPVIQVLNKVDLLQAPPETLPPLAGAPCVPISALRGDGLARLEEEIVHMVLGGHAVPSAPVVTNPRHQEALHRALEHVEAADAAYQRDLPADLIAIDVAGAVQALGEITGQTAGEDVVDSIFRDFCIGK